MVISSWRTTQLERLNIQFADQDKSLIDFVNSHSISTLILEGSDSLGYFQSHLNNAVVTNLVNIYPDSMLAIFANKFFYFEDLLNSLSEKLLKLQPKYFYIAVNKYLVQTNTVWPNLTDNYDQDLLNILEQKISSIGYIELARKYIQDDRGQYFNFVHPTTNAYYKVQ